MRITDRSVWTAPPPTPIATCTVQVAGGPGGLATYYYRLVTHYPIGDVISEPFEVSNAPKPMSAAHYVIISWQGIPGVTSYDLLRTDTFQLPPDGTNCALAIGLAPTATIFNDQGQTLLPYSISGLKAGSPVDGWAMMNNRDFSEPVLELWPTIRLTKILFGDGSEQQSAGGGVIAGVSSVFGRTGVVTAQSGDYNAGQITLVPPIGTWTTVQNALQAIANGASQTPWKSDIDGGGFDLTNVGNIEAGNIDVTGSITINGQPITGGGTPHAPNNSLQFNNSGAFGGSANLTWVNSKVQVAGADPGVILRDTTGNDINLHIVAVSNSSTNPLYNTYADGALITTTDDCELVIAPAGAITLNPATAGVYMVWLTGGTGGYALGIDQVTGRVGIGGQQNPQFTLDIKGDINVSGGGYYIDGILFAGTGSGSSPGGYASVGPTPPASPQDGQFWFSTSTLRLNIWALGTWIQI